MTWFSEALAYLRLLVGKTLTLSLLIIDLLLFIASLVIDSFQPPRGWFVGVALVAFVLGAFEVHRDQAKAHQSAIAQKEQALAAVQSKDASTAALEKLSVALEKSAPFPAVASPSFVGLDGEPDADFIPPGTDTTPVLIWAEEPGRQYEFEAIDGVGRMTRWAGNKVGVPKPDDDAVESWPDYRLRLFGRLQNGGPTRIDVASVEGHVSTGNWPVDFNFDDDTPPFVLGKGESIPIVFSADVLGKTYLNAEKAAVRLGAITYDDMIFKVEIQLRAVASDGNQSELLKIVDVSFRPMFDSLVALWRLQGRDDLLRFANANRVG